MGREAGFLQKPVAAVMRPLFRLAWDITVEGFDNLPTSGPAILCPNHTSVLDSFILPAVLPRPILYVGKAEYLDDWKTKHLFPAIGMIPIDRSGGESAQAALDTAAGVLESGGLFGIYPEGTRSRSGLLYKGHTGPARLALRTGAPIIPIGLQGVREIQPPDAPYPKVGRPATVKFGKPIEVTHYRDRASDRLLLRQLIDEVMYEIGQLTGQEYVNEYASKANAELAAKTAGGAAERVEPKVDHDPVRDLSEVVRRSSADVLKAPALV